TCSAVKTGRDTMQHRLLTLASPVVLPESAKAASQPEASTKTRTAQERYFETHDGTRLFYRYWPAPNSPVAPAIILLHRGHEHSGRLQHIVEELNLPDFAMFAWDARGHGRSASAGDSPDFGTLVRDLDAFARHVASAYCVPLESMAIISQSVGSVLAAAWAHDYAPEIRCMVLSAPAFKIKLYVPLAYPALRLLHRLRGEFHVNSYVKPRVLTHDPERIASYQA